MLGSLHDRDAGLERDLDHLRAGKVLKAILLVPSATFRR